MKKHLKILIADDSELMKSLMRSILLKYLVNPVVMQTENLEETYKVLDEENFDLLLLDINMPAGDNTPQTVAEIKQKYPDLNVVMFSGNDKETLEPLYTKAGAFGFIKKDENINWYTKVFFETYFN
ncbi:response regulator [Pedobacter rhodius]|uniref:Response regulator n=1 Tax=Pedobacter rhodius TaxID=3004098 RepID=A0ABT4KXV0_9SPHI|nr:response regulator [Pedobacter sp. SJ11]MCZ4223052.1 response regulator [Pedobacter sp. SJ11]